MKKTSFIKRLFLSLIILYFFVFLGMFIFQRVIFQRFYTNRVIRNTINEIDTTLNNLDNQNPDELIVEFSQNTQTTALLIPAQELQNDINKLSLLITEISTDDGIISVITPNRIEFQNIDDKRIRGNVYLHEPSGLYIPSSLTIDGTQVLHSRGGQINMLYRDLIKDIDIDSKLQFTGTVIEVTAPSEVTPPDINPIISNEVLNILSENYDGVTKFDNGFYYTSVEENELGNIVFYSNENIDGNNMILIAVYPLAHISDIIGAMQLVNIYIFIAVLSILAASSLFYSKRFSTPILRINNATKELSDLNFDTNLVFNDRNDEFTELAFNISTLSKNLQETLYRLNEQNKQLSESIDRENKNEEARINFIRGMSHELKTPLAVIQASSEAVQKNIFTSEEDREDSLNLINSEVQKISTMINDMMNIYRLDNAQYKDTFTVFSISNLLQEYLTNLDILFRKKKLNIKTSIEESYINGDKKKIGLVLSNLLTNAIKYTPEDESVSINLFHEDGYIYFRIENFGTSIPNESLNEIFDPFYRVDKARSRTEGNSGLGLYIVQQTLKQHESACKVENIDNGVSFSFKIKSSD